MSILKIKDENGNVKEITVIRGNDGKDGETPHIAGGNWWVGDVDTYVKAEGKDYVLTDADKQEIATNVINKLSTETWTFTLEDGSTVNKTVVLR